jgi:potassium channel subfamily K
MVVADRIRNLEEQKNVNSDSSTVERGRRFLPAIKKIFTVALYFTVGCLFFTNVEEKDCENQPGLMTSVVEVNGENYTLVEIDEAGEARLDGPLCTQAWTGLDAMYYSVVTVCTVGYGDFAPSTVEGRIFAMFYILVGLGVIFTVLNDAAKFVLETVQGAALERLDDDPDDNEAPHGAKIAISLFAIVICVLLGTWFFTWSESWTFSEAVWWCLVTSTTVGYGDMSLENESSKIFSIFYILMSVMTVATAIGNFQSIHADMEAEKKRNQLLEMELNEDMLTGLDKTGEGSLDKEEFVTGMLALLGLVEDEDVEPWRQRFDTLDEDNSGELDSDDLKKIAAEEAAKAASRRQQMEANKITLSQWLKNKIYGKGSHHDKSTVVVEKEELAPEIEKTDQRELDSHREKRNRANSLILKESSLFPAWLHPYKSALTRVTIICAYFIIGVVFFTHVEERECDEQPNIKVYEVGGADYYRVMDSGEFELEGEACMMPWTIVDSVYYSIVTVTTTGYGDYAPDTVGGRYFAMVYILVGLGVIFKFIAEFASYIIQTAQEHALNKLDDDPNDDKAPHGAKIAISIIAMFITVVLGAAFFQWNEDWEFLDGFWWSFITTVTVGYGDLSLTKETSRIFSIFYIMFSVMIVAASIGNLAVVASEIEHEKNRRRLLEKSLDENLILNLDKDGSGSIDKEEFVTGMLVLLELVNQDDVNMWRSRFLELDAVLYSLHSFVSAPTIGSLCCEIAFIISWFISIHYRTVAACLIWTI